MASHTETVKRKKKKQKVLSTKQLVQRAKERRHQRAAKKKRLDKQILAALSKSPAHSGHTTQTDALSATTLPMFPRFLELPAELRKMIWEYALPGPRVFEPCMFEIEIGYSLTELCHLHGRHSPPSIRGVCKESWKITEKNGIFMFGNHQTFFHGTRERVKMHGCWFNPERDVIYLSAKTDHPHRDSRCPENPTAYTQRMWCSLIAYCRPKTIALRSQFVQMSPEIAWNYIQAGCSVDTVMLMHEDDTIHESWYFEPIMYPLQDEDVVVVQWDPTTSDEGPDEVRGVWGNVKEEIMDAFWEAGPDPSSSSWRPSKVENIRVIRR